MTPEELARLQTRTSEIQARLTAINTEAGDAELNEAQAAEWAQLTDEARDVGDQISEHERRERVEENRRRWGSTQVATRVDPFDELDVRRLSVPQARDNALRVLDTRDHNDHLSDRQKRHVDTVLNARNRNCDGDYVARLMLATHNEHYRNAFMKRMLFGSDTWLTQEEGRAVQQVNELRAMSLGVDAGGGFAVPVLIDPTVILTDQGSPNDILNLARVVTITNDRWKGLSSAGMSWRFRAEASAATDNSPTIASPEVVAHAADGYIPFSYEIDMDWPGFRDEMGRLIGSGYREMLAEKLTLGAGDGSDEPFGIVTALDANTNVEVPTAAGGALAPGDIYGLWAALPIRYRQSGERVAWMSSTDVHNSIRQLGTVDPNFTQRITEGGTAPLFDAQYAQNDYMSDTVAGTAAGNLLVVGAWENYLVAQRAGMSIELVPHVFDVTNNRPTGQRAFYGFARVGADAINDGGFRLLQNNEAE